MQEQFVTYEIALKLKELGFNEWCWFQYYEGNLDYCYKYEKKSTNIPTIRTACLAPLWQQVIDWFRTNYDIHIGLIPYTNPANGIVNVLYEYSISTKENSYEGGIDNSIARLQEKLKTKKPSYINLFNSYEAAREQAILKVIELCKKN